MIKKRRRRKNNDFRLSLPEMEINEEVRRDIFGIFLFTSGVITALSFISLAGKFGEDLNKVARTLFGYGFIFLPILLFFWGVKIVKSENIIKSRYYLFGVFLVVLFILTILHVNYEQDRMFELAKSGVGGGYLGASVAWFLVGIFGKWGGTVIALALMLMSVVFTFQISFLQILNIFRIPSSVEKVNIRNGNEKIKRVINKSEDKASGLVASLREKLKASKSDDSENANDNANDNEEQAEEPSFSIKPISAGAAEDKKESGQERDLNERSKADGGSEADEESHITIDSFSEKVSNWKLPSPDLLDGSDSEPKSGDIQGNLNIIKRTLANFGIQVEMGGVNIGPTVTQYTLKPSEGVKLSKITSLQNDLALALAARTIRIEAPIPGKSWVGIELPNKSVAMVTLKTILESPEFKSRKSNLNMILGRDVSGSSVIANIAKMPHLMIAGSTGSGKTVCINTLISGLLFQNSPQELKFIMIDPKRVELTPYNDIPHLLTPVIVDPEKAINSLKWAVKEMENRYDMLSRFGCRNIESYNQTVLTKHKDQDPLHYIIIIIDEMADLMATHGREMEAVVVRLAQMARAVGIHLVLSTQRPSVEVITGLIKANITTRVAFLVASQIDSRTILDSAGAEKLLGNGDMLYQSGEFNKPKRIQGVFISEDEVKKIVDYIKSQKQEENEYNSEIVESKKFSSDPMEENGEIEEELYLQALEVVRDTGKASATLLQRKLRIGYPKAARILDVMENRGVVGPSQGAKPREIYLDLSEEINSGGPEEY